MKHAPERYNDIVAVVAKRLKAITRFEAAAELYESIEAAAEAINCYMSGEVWDKARILAQQQMPSMVRTVEERYKSHLVGQGDADELIKKTGDVASALDMYARQDDWSKCLSLAEKHSPKMLPHYLIQYCKILANKGEISQAAEALVRYGVPVEQENFKLYKIITIELLSSTDGTSFQMLREMLMRFMSDSTGTKAPTPKALAEDRGPQSKEFLKSLIAAQLLSNRSRFKEMHKSPELVAKISVSLCRYCAELPCDQAFYQAGLDCRDANMINMAFLFLNRFLDISDAIEDPDNAGIDNMDFKDTDIPDPVDLELPETPFVQATEAEDIRDKVLAWSMDPSVQQKMDTRQCEKCREEIYAAACQCPKCGHQHEPCVVTGYPVLKRTRVECTNCRAAANRDDWNGWLQLFKTCPWCSAPQNAQY
jgi:intraflagellar transport protein 172